MNKSSSTLLPRKDKVGNDPEKGSKTNYPRKFRLMDVVKLKHNGCRKM